MEGRKKGLGVQKKSKLRLKRTTHNTTKTKKKRSLGIIRGIVDYLKSDSYFYSSLLSSSPSPHSSAQGKFLSLLLNLIDLPPTNTRSDANFEPVDFINGLGWL